MCILKFVITDIYLSKDHEDVQFINVATKNILFYEL